MSRTRGSPEGNKAMKVKLSMAFQDMRGKDGTVVISKSRTGLVAKPRVRGRNPKTPAQASVRGNLAKAAATFKNFTTAQVNLWASYALTITKHNPITGQTYNPTPINAFVALAAKFLQCTPGGTIPTTPPTSAYTGDTPTITALAGTGKVTFTASAGMAIGNKAELLLQPLKGKNRVPNSKGYRSKAFNYFAPGSLSFDVTVPTGTYAAAYRYVNTATGQETNLIPIGVHNVSLALEQGGSAAKKKAA